MRPSGRDLAIVLAVSGGLGFATGVARPEHQVAVETAQVIAGIVHYPPGNPFFIYHLKLWNLASQLLALLLLAGVPERALSVALSGVLGAVSFQALALCALATSRDRVLAIALPPWILAISAYDLGVNYDIALLGSEHTFGVLGTSWALLALALLGVGRTGAGLCALAIAPAVHPPIGIWVLGIALLALALDAGGRDALRAHAHWLLYGLAVTGLSLGAQLWWSGRFAVEKAATDELAIRDFVRYWDWHRRPVSLADPVFILTAGFVALAAAWLAAPRLRARLDAGAAHLLRALAVSAALALGFAVLTIWQDRLPLPLVVAMPGRHVNLSSLAALPVLLGLLAAPAAAGPGAVLLGAVAVLAGFADALTPRSLLLAIELAAAALALAIALGIDRGSRRIEAVARAVAVGFFAATALLRQRLDPPTTAGLLAAAAALAVAIDPPRRLASLRAARPLAAALAAIAVVLSAVRAEHVAGPPLDWLRDYANDPFFARVAEGQGMLLTAGSLHLVQLRTRRPVLLDGGGLDGLPYAPGAARPMERILTQVYEVNLHDPPDDIRASRPGALLPDTGSWEWQNRSHGRWIALAREFGFSEVLTPIDWHLPLRREERSLELALWSTAREPETPPAASMRAVPPSEEGR